MRRRTEGERIQKETEFGPGLFLIHTQQAEHLGLDVLLVDPDGPAAQLKTTTGLVGLDVEPHWKEKLTALYEQTLEDAKALPEDSKYRQNVEAISKFRMKVVQEEEHGDAVEARVDCGQVEEMIAHAKDELNLLQYYAEMKLHEAAPEE